jgi:membrane protease YdiL (CAAX protease family)
VTRRLFGPAILLALCSAGMRAGPSEFGEGAVALAGATVIDGTGAAGGHGMEGRGRFPYRFLVVTFFWAWTLWLPLVLASFRIIPLGKEFVAKVWLPVTLLAGFGPALGALYSLRTLNGKGAILRHLRGTLDLRLGWKAWIIPIIVLGGSTYAVYMLPERWVGPRPATGLPLWFLPLFLLAMVVLGGGQEELGWRGYILDPMEDRLGPSLGNLVLGVVWAVWHLPLFFIPYTCQASMPFAGFMLLMTGWSCFFSWVRQSSGKRVFSGLYAHGVANTFGSMFPTIVMATDASRDRFWIWVSLNFAIGLGTMAIRSLKSNGTYWGPHNIATHLGWN